MKMIPMNKQFKMMTISKKSAMKRISAMPFSYTKMINFIFFLWI